MAQVELVMPKMGESITDATIIKWYKKPGDRIEEDEIILEVATDKVDSEIPSPTAGTMGQILCKVDDVVNVGEVIAIIETTESSNGVKLKTEKKKSKAKIEDTASPKSVKPKNNRVPKPLVQLQSFDENRFYSPLVRNIARKENIANDELSVIPGSGAKGRVTKDDILLYAKNKARGIVHTPPAVAKPIKAAPPAPEEIKLEEGDEIEIMDRMRKLIANHMTHSKKTSAHVTSFAEADMTSIYNWRSRIKDDFKAKYGHPLSFTPIILEIVAQAIEEFPKINSSVVGDSLVIKKAINIGMATALPNGNLIVPVIHKTNEYDLVELAEQVNLKAKKAKENGLKASDIQKGTFTLTNIGTFGSLLGTPIINQPEVAILATGAIKKKPVVVETPDGDTIAIRKMMFLSLSYDHRVIDGYLGGTFLESIVKRLETFDENRKI